MIIDNQKANETISPNSLEIEQLKQALPHYFDTEGNFKLEQFQAMLSNEKVDFSKESYELNFVGKSYAKYLASLKTETVLLPDYKHNNLEANKDSQNIYITGDNLDTLKHLKESYSGAIKCIYIDPPYNTGSDGFAYNDSFSFTVEVLVDKIGLSEKEAERVLDLHGRSSHSAWLTFMLPRLILAKQLLTIDGAIIMSIDENEFSNLNQLADEIFGEENHVGTFVWSGGRKNDSKYISTSHEYALVYARNFSYLKGEKINWKARKKGLEAIYKQEEAVIKEANGDLTKASKLLAQWFKDLPESDPAKNHSHYKVIDERGVFFPDNISWPGGGGPEYEVLHPMTGKPVKIPSRGWLFSSPDRMQEMIDNDMVVFGEDENKVPNIKRYLRETEYEAPYSVLYKDGRASTKRLTTLMGENYFGFPKDEDILIELINLVLQDTKGIILDFFSGSASTAHAVMKANSLDGGTRKYIMVQIQEALNPKAKDKPTKNAIAAGYRTIDRIAQDRIVKAAAKIKADTGADIDYGFKHFTLHTPPQSALDDLVDFNPDEALFQHSHISRFDTKEATGKDILLTTWANYDGYGLLHSPQEVKLHDFTLMTVGRHGYVLDSGLKSEDVVELIQLLENDELEITTLVYLNDCVQLHVLQSLKQSLKNLSSRKVNMIARY